MQVTPVRGQIYAAPQPLLENPAHDSRGLDVPDPVVPSPDEYPYDPAPREEDPLHTGWGFGCIENHYNTKIARAVESRWDEGETPLPPVLFKALIAAESAFDTVAHSHAGAAGLVQLMPGTARAFGLSVSPIDERLVADKALPVGVSVLAEKFQVVAHPPESTWWGAKVAEAYQQFGAPEGEQLWTLVLAGYNGGASTVVRAMAEAFDRGLDPRDWSNLTSSPEGIENAPLYKAVEDIYGSADARRKFREMAAYPGRVLGYFNRAGRPLEGRRIVIDAGHGGPDPGAIGRSGLEEADVNLAISLKLRDKLQAMGANVRMTRDTDSSVAPPGSGKRAELQARVDVANRWPAQLFVSVHSNSSVRPEVHGTEVYIARQSSEASRQMANHIHQEMVDQLGLRDNGVRRQDFYVVKNTTMPAVLVETAYISNATEEALLGDPNFQERAAEAIADGLVAFDEQRRLAEQEECASCEGYLVA